MKFKCIYCDHFYSTKFNLRTHIQTQHPDESLESLEWVEPTIVPNFKVAKPELTCQHCRKTFKGKKNLEYHLQSFHGKREKKFKCESCDKLFVEQSTLNRHNATFHRAKICEFCDGSESEHDPQCQMYVAVPSVSIFVFSNIFDNYHLKDEFWLIFKQYSNKDLFKEKLICFFSTMKKMLTNMMKLMVCKLNCVKFVENLSMTSNAPEKYEIRIQGNQVLLF